MGICYRVWFDNDESSTRFGPDQPCLEAARLWAAENGPGRRYRIAEVGPDENGPGRLLE